MVHRERAAEFQKFAFLGRVIGAALGVDSSRLARAEEMLAATIFQTLHDPQSMRRRVEENAQRAKQEREGRLRDARLMAKTAGYSEDDDEKEDGDAFMSALRQRQTQRRK